jgi:hypothetical protein
MSKLDERTGYAVRLFRNGCFYKPSTTGIGLSAVLRTISLSTGVRVSIRNDGFLVLDTRHCPDLHRYRHAEDSQKHDAITTKIFDLLSAVQGVFHLQSGLYRGIPSLPANNSAYVIAVFEGDFPKLHQLGVDYSYQNDEPYTEIDVTVINDFEQLLTSIDGRDSDTELRLFRLAYSGSFASQHGDFDSALAIFGVLLEQLVYQYWRCQKQKFESLPRFPNKNTDSEIIFTKGDRINHSTRIELLHATGLIHDELYVNLKNINKARNRLIHSMSAVDRASLSICGHCVAQLSIWIYGYNISLHIKSQSTSITEEWLEVQ